jgi:hypothetical protein
MYEYVCYIRNDLQQKINPNDYNFMCGQVIPNPHYHATFANPNEYPYSEEYLSLHDLLLFSADAINKINYIINNEDKVIIRDDYQKLYGYGPDVFGIYNEEELQLKVRNVGREYQEKGLPIPEEIQLQLVKPTDFYLLFGEEVKQKIVENYYSPKWE